MKKFLSIAAATAFAFAGGGGLTGGATEFTQLAQFGADVADRAASYGKLVEQYLVEAEQLQLKWQEWYRRIKGLEATLNNIGHLPEMLQADLSRMALEMKNALERGQAISYSARSIDSLYKKIFPGYDYYLNQKELTPEYLEQEYRKYYQSTQDSALNALNALGIQENALQSDELFLQSIKQAMNAAQGTEAALAVGNQIAYNQIVQMQRLQRALMLQAQLQAQAMARKNEQEAMRRAYGEWYRKRDVIRHDNDVPMDALDDLPGSNK